MNSASYPLQDGKWVVAYELWGEDLVWLIGAVVCLCAAPRVQLFVRGAMDGCIVRHGIIDSCQSAATSKIVKALMVTTHKSVSCKQRCSKYPSFTFNSVTAEIGIVLLWSGLEVGKKNYWYDPFPCLLPLFPSHPFLSLPLPFPFLSSSPIHSPPLRSRPLKSSCGVWGSAVSCPSGIWGRAPAANGFLAHFAPRKRIWTQQF